MKYDKEKKLGLAHSLFSRTLHTYFLVRRGLTIGVRAIVRSDDGRFLLVRHTYTPGWHFPGGGVERRESIENALYNELKQEVGLHLDGKPVLHGVFYNKGVSSRDHILAYLCDVREDFNPRPTSLEIAEVGYFHVEDLPQNTDLGTVRRIQEVVTGKEIGETW